MQNKKAVQIIIWVVIVGMVIGLIATAVTIFI